MTIIALLVWVFILGLIVYLVYKYATIPAGFKALIYCICIVIAIIVTLSAFGLLHDLNAQVPKLR